MTATERKITPAEVATALSKALADTPTPTVTRGMRDAVAAARIVAGGADHREVSDPTRGGTRTPLATSPLPTGVES